MSHPMSLDDLIAELERCRAAGKDRIYVKADYRPVGIHAVDTDGNGDVVLHVKVASPRWDD